jgi:hypothetical protein
MGHSTLLRLKQEKKLVGVNESFLFAEIAADCPLRYEPQLIETTISEAKTVFMIPPPLFGISYEF